MKKKVLITGGLGYIGSHITLMLFQLGFDVYIIDSFINCSPINLRNLKELDHKNLLNGIHVNKGDIRDLSFLERLFSDHSKNENKFTAVIHLAGLKSVYESTLDPIAYWDVNVNGTINLLKIMRKYDCKNIIFSSSATVYGNTEKTLLKEDLPFNPSNPYGETKVAIERILSDVFYSDLGNWKICNLRYFNPVGADPSGLFGEKFSLNPYNLLPYLNLVATGEKRSLSIFGNDWPTKDGTPIRDYVHVSDLAYGHVLAMNYLVSNDNQVLNINIGTGKGNSVLELIDTFQRVNNCEIRYEFKERRPGDVASLVADNDLLKNIFKWSPQRSIDEMCKDSWNWFLKNKVI